jgi:hypothetical protein
LLAVRLLECISADFLIKVQPVEPNGPSIFTAVKEQFGLELKPITGLLDTIVIDRPEIPTENCLAWTLGKSRVIGPGIFEPI